MMIKTFEEYQKRADATAVYKNINNNLLYPVLGIGGESGEILEKMKKLERDFDNTMTEEYRLEMIKEGGDLIWYLAAYARELGSSFEEMATMNIQKLEDRKNRGVLKGSGDNR